MKCMATYFEPAAPEECVPTKDDLTAVYKFLAAARKRTDKFDLYNFTISLNKNDGKKISPYIFKISIDIFEELGLLTIDEKNLTFDLPPAKSKRDLKNSRTFRLLQKNC